MEHVAKTAAIFAVAHRLSANFNILHIDGNNAEVAAMMKATLPRAFIIGPDGLTTVDTNYFTSIELTRTAPAVVTYTIILRRCGPTGPRSPGGTSPARFISDQRRRQLRSLSAAAPSVWRR